MSFQEVVDRCFPGSMPQDELVQRSYAALGGLGFDADNTIACAGVCRDEICRPLVGLVREAWGEAFNFSSLGGMLTLGAAGFRAAHHHAPLVGGRERYAHFAMAHIAIGAEGQLGRCFRAGRPEPSSACGALVGFHAELSSGRVNLELDPDDVEFSILKQRLVRRLDWGASPDLVELTREAHAQILDDLERMIGLTVDEDTADWAVLTGVQIHAPDGGTLLWPGTLYAVVEGQRQELQI